MSLHNPDANLASILSHLELLSSIQPGDKVCYKTRQCVPRSSWYGALYRYWYDENRADLINELESLFTKCNTVYSTLILSQLCDFHEALTRALVGIINLATTYADDNITRNRINQLVENFRSLSCSINIHKNYLSNPRDTLPPISLPTTPISTNNIPSDPIAKNINLKYIPLIDPSKLITPVPLPRINKPLKKKKVPELGLLNVLLVNDNNVIIKHDCF